MASLVAKVLGLGSTDEERTANNETGGQEPVSGQMGEGTATSPYDMGNSEEANRTESAEQRTLGNETGGAEPISGELGAGTAASPYDQGNDEKAQGGAVAQQGSEQQQQQQQSSSTTLPDRTRKDDPSIGSPDWFKTALPKQGETSSSSGSAAAGRTNEATTSDKQSSDKVAEQPTSDSTGASNSDPTAVDKKHPNSNPSSIPTAGGIPLGTKPVDGR